MRSPFAQLFVAFLVSAAVVAIPCHAEAPLEMIALGEKLFSDVRLSRDGTISCASCHDPKQAFTNPSPPTRPGLTDTRLRRDVPSLLNVAFAHPLHHDGREPSLEVQILAPLFNEAEMANTTFDDLTSRLAAIPEYRNAFHKVFQAKPAIDTLGAALASFERSLKTGYSPFDKWRPRELDPESSGMKNFEFPKDAEAGYALFKGKAGCDSCHPATIEVSENGPNPLTAIFTANEFLNTGIGFQSEARRAAEHPKALADRGREEVTHRKEDRYKFRTPTLRNVELTAPYMHDGSLKTLEDVVAYYNAGGSADPEKDARIRPLGLSADEQIQLVAFLKSLTSPQLPGGKSR